MLKKIINIILGALILALFYSNANAASNLLFFNIISQAEARKCYIEAVNLNKKKDIAGALEKYETAVSSYSVLISEPDYGLKDKLLKKYEALSQKTSEVEFAYKYAYLCDLTGEIDAAIDNYEKAKGYTKDAAVLENLTLKINSLYAEKNFLNKPLFMNENSAGDRAPADAASDKAEAVNGSRVNGDGVNVNNENKSGEALDEEYNQEVKSESPAETQKAQLKEAIEELSKKIEEAEKNLADSKTSAQKAKNDWSGRTESQRTWRDRPDSLGGKDESDPYQNTYRRRYRQAKTASEEAQKNLEILLNKKKELETQLNAQQTETPSSEPAE